jgi:hypothetical protein
MRQTFILLGALALLVAQPLAAAEPQPQSQSQPLSPGKPAGVGPAQLHNMLPVYGGVVLFGALLAVTIGVSGSSISSAAAIGATPSTTYCCG